MAITTVNNPATLNAAAGDYLETLLIPVAADRVLLSYETATKLDGRITVETVPAGAESVQFDMIGDASAVYREIGKSILEDNAAAANDTPSRTNTGSEGFMEAINHGRRKVYLDRPLMGGPVFIDDFMGFLSTLNDGGRTPILGKLGYAIAKAADIQGLSFAAKCCATTGHGGIDWSATEIPTEFQPTTPGDNWVVDANAATDGSALLDGIRQVCEYWDENDVPEEGRAFYVKPAQYNLLVQNQDLLNRDFGNQNGIFSDGTVFRAWGAELVKTNHVGTDGVTANGNFVRSPEGYDFANASDVAALGIQSEALVKARGGGMSLMVKDYGFEYGGHAMVAEMAFGYDCFRPLGIGAVATATT